jgi:hypothetical protein
MESPIAGTVTFNHAKKPGSGANLPKESIFNYSPTSLPSRLFLKLANATFFHSTAIESSLESN